MSRTYKYSPSWRVYRSRRGIKQNRIHGRRPGSLPELDPWWAHNKFPDNQCELPYKIAKALAEKEWTDEDIIKHLRQKFGMSQGEARRRTEWVNRESAPEGCLRVAEGDYLPL